MISYNLLTSLILILQCHNTSNRCRLHSVLLLFLRLGETTRWACGTFRAYDAMVIPGPASTLCQHHGLNNHLVLRSRIPHFHNPLHSPTTFCASTPLSHFAGVTRPYSQNANTTRTRPSVCAPPSAFSYHRTCTRRRRPPTVLTSIFLIPSTTVRVCNIITTPRPGDTD